MEVDGGFEAKVFFGIKAEIAAELAVANASAGVSVGPELSAGVDLDGCLELAASVRVSAQVSASALWVFEWSVSVVLARIGFLVLVLNCTPGGSTSTSTSSSTTTTTTTTTSTPPNPGFHEGQLTNLVVGAGLNCDVQSPVDGRSVYYGSGACATLTYIDGLTYGTSVPASGGFARSWTPVSQTIAGTATAADPLVVRTTVAAADTGIELTQTDYFIDGNPGYQTDITIRNTSGSAKDVKIYRAVDCYLSNNDVGTGSIYASSVSCNASSGRRIAFTDLSGDAHRQESHFDQIWSVAKSGSDYDGTSISTDHDNGMGINWNRTVPAGGVITLRSRFQLDEPNEPAGGAAARASERRASPGDEPDTKEVSAATTRPLPTSVPTA